MRQQVLTRYSTSKRKRTFNFLQCLRFVETFCTRHGITPNDQTSSILLSGIRKLDSRRGVPTTDKRKEGKEEEDALMMDWQKENVAEVISRIRVFVTGDERRLQKEQGS